MADGQAFSELAQDLEIIAQLRNLQEEVKILIPTIMPVTIDITRSSAFKAGELKGELKVIKAMLVEGLPLSQIVKFTNLSMEEIEKLAQEIKNQK